MLFRKETPSSPDAGIKAPAAVAPLIIIAVFGVWAGFPNDLISIPLFILLWPLALCFLGIKATGRERAFYYGWLASFGGAVAALYWLCFPVRDVGALPWPLAIVCALIICACLSLQGGFFSLVARYCGIRTKSSVIILALSWYLLEYVFAVITGFPWLVISGALASWPFTLQTAEFFGAYLSSALWLMGVLFIVSGYIRDGGRSSTGFFGRQEIYGYLIIVFICAYGVYGLGKKDSGEELDVLY
ncbi:MAG: hypothetical protein K2H64_06190, partial [Desulfovibrio sp.]|nr:hypothetical protein [Desulfovibrio sp.]